MEPNVFVHPTAIIDEGVSLGAGTKIWHFAHVVAGAQIGENVMLGQGTYVGGGARIGNGCRIQNVVNVFDAVTLEDDVFVGPCAVFTNVFNPRAFLDQKSQYRFTLVQKGATIGANATIVCGNTIGRYAFIGAGAVVTHDVPNFALMMGVPTRQTGWMCQCGTRLPSFEGTSTVRCPTCNVFYVFRDRVVQVIDEEKGNQHG
jgi:UDP-2-acetamido-3-amino-2,3-dideoxy-glucuronate N-acetyltransferase